MEERKCLYCRKIFQTDIPGKKYCCRKCSVKYRRHRKDGYKNKNELKRRIDLFLHDFTHEEYRINEEYCKETMRIMVDFIGHVDNRLDAADKRLKKAKAGEKALAEYIISNAHSCPIPVEMVCKPGFQQIGCVQCLIKHLDVLNKPRED